MNFRAGEQGRDCTPTEPTDDAKTAMTEMASVAQHRKQRAKHSGVSTEMTG